MNICLFETGPLLLEYLEHMSSSGFVCLKEVVPTTIGAGSQTLIDHAFGIFHKIQTHFIDITDSCDVSEHQLIDLSLWADLSRPQRDTGRIIRKIDYEKTNTFPEGLDWSNLYL